MDIATTKGSKYEGPFWEVEGDVEKEKENKNKNKNKDDDLDLG